MEVYLTKLCQCQLWDNQSLYSNNPDFTECFQKTILTWSPCLFLWILAPFWIIYLLKCKQKLITVDWSMLLAFKIIGSVLLVSVEFLRIIKASETKLFINYLNSISLIITYSLVLSIITVEKFKQRRTSMLLFLFWLFFASVNSIKLRSLILKYVSQANFEINAEFIENLLFYSMVYFNMVLFCFNEKSKLDKKKQTNSLEKEASVLSKLTFHWINSVIFLGYSKEITRDELPELKESQTSEFLTHKFESVWNQMANNYIKSLNGKRIESDDPNVNLIVDEQRKPSICWCLVKIFYGKILFAAFLKLVHDILVFTSPFLLSVLLQFIIDSNQNIMVGVFVSIVLFLSSSIRSFLLQHYFNIMYNSGAEVRTALTNLVYKKSLILSLNARRESTIGEITNLVAVNSQALLDLFPYLNIIWSGPFQIIVGMAMLWSYLGFASLIGLLVMLVFIPINTYKTSLKSAQQKVHLKYQDSRIKMMNEILVGMRIIKFMGWELCFTAVIDKIRQIEMKYLNKICFINCLSYFLWTSTPFLVSVASFGVYALWNQQNKLDPMVVFVSVCLFEIIKFPLNVFPYVISTLLQSYLGLIRISDFLLREELDLQAVKHSIKLDPSVKVTNGNFSWDKKQISLRNINLEVKSGSLVAIIGSVGSGKTSLLSALLGEMYKVNNDAEVLVNGRVAYVPQQPWIKNTTFKENILFGRELYLDKYEKVIQTCALAADLEIMKAGDATEIGENGINLSGGQKQRINLARAVYNDADIYLMDDSLSAVDSHVAKHIFDQVIGPYGILNNKTRIFATNSIGFLPQVDHVIMMDNGVIIENGTFSELRVRSSVFANFIRTVAHENPKTETIEPKKEKKEDEVLIKKNFSERELNRLNFQPVKLSKNGHSNSILNANEISVGKLIKKENVETGAVKARIIMEYLKSANAVLLTCFSVCMIISNVFMVINNIWLSEWSNEGLLKQSYNRFYYLFVYFFLGLMQCLFVLLSRIFHMFMSNKVALKLHKRMLCSVMRSKVEFFDSTPFGRIMNRFSRDVDAIENSIPVSMIDFLSQLLGIVSLAITISLSTYYFLISLVPIMFIYVLIQRYFIASTRQLKRLESSSKSPIFSHLTESLAGVSTIRAYKAEERFTRMMQRNLDENLIFFYPNRAAVRWLSLRLEMIGNLITFFSAFFAVICRNTINAGLAGVSISFSLNISSVLNNFVRVSTDFESNITSIEAIKEYCELTPESQWELITNKPDKSWPQNGHIIFKDYSVKYREELDNVLCNLSFEIMSREKIGIVGRTGAGKSSLTLALFRLIEYHTGEIFIDDVEIHSIGLHDLRQKMTMIPQDPILFSSSIRFNLDPFNNHTDAELWDVLDLVNFRSFFENTDKKLDFQLNEGGNNLSVGQRQLICLARALLRKSKIIVMDEATASIDHNTDELIQETIKKQFIDCTVITIAHRLNTVMDSDRIMVIDNGRIVEFDTPQNLLINSDGLFYSMALNAGLLE